MAFLLRLAIQKHDLARHHLHGAGVMYHLLNSGKRRTTKGNFQNALSASPREPDSKALGQSSKWKELPGLRVLQKEVGGSLKVAFSGPIQTASHSQSCEGAFLLFNIHLLLFQC
jgi:hypothetical protein